MAPPSIWNSRLLMQAARRLLHSISPRISLRRNTPSQLRLRLRPAGGSSFFKVRILISLLFRPFRLTRRLRRCSASSRQTSRTRTSRSSMMERHRPSPSSVRMAPPSIWNSRLLIRPLRRLPQPILHRLSPAARDYSASPEQCLPLVGNLRSMMLLWAGS